MMIEGFDKFAEKTKTTTLFAGTYSRKKAQCEEWLKFMGIHNARLDSSLSVNVYTNVNLDSGKLRGCPELPVKFKKVDGYFISEYNDLVTLERFPDEVTGKFNISWSKKITNLMGSPSVVGGEFIVDSCPELSSLEGSPKSVKNFSCVNNRVLKNLKGGPERVEEVFDCSGCTNIKTLEGGPIRIGKYINCSGCVSLVSLNGLASDIGENYVRREEVSSHSYADLCRCFNTPIERLVELLGWNFLRDNDPPFDEEIEQKLIKNAKLSKITWEELVPFLRSDTKHRIRGMVHGDEFGL